MATTASLYNHSRATRQLLKRHKKEPPSFIIHLLPNQSFRFERQNGAFLMDGPLKDFLGFIRSHRLPADFVDVLIAAGVQFFEGCLIVEIRDHRIHATKSSPSASRGAVPTTASLKGYRRYGGSYGAKEDLMTSRAAAASGSAAGLFGAPNGLRPPELPQTYRVVLQPSGDTLWEDIKAMSAKDGLGWNDDEALEVEARILSLVSPPLCLEPDVQVGRIANLMLSSTVPLATASTGARRIETEPEDQRAMLAQARRSRILRLMEGGSRSLNISMPPMPPLGQPMPAAPMPVPAFFYPTFNRMRFIETWRASKAMEKDGARKDEPGPGRGSEGDADSKVVKKPPAKKKKITITTSARTKDDDAASVAAEDAPTPPTTAPPPAKKKSKKQREKEEREKREREEAEKARIAAEAAAAAAAAEAAKKSKSKSKKSKKSAEEAGASGPTSAGLASSGPPSADTSPGKKAVTKKTPLKKSSANGRKASQDLTRESSVAGAAATPSPAAMLGSPASRAMSQNGLSQGHQQNVQSGQKHIGAQNVLQGAPLASQPTPQFSQQHLQALSQSFLQQLPQGQALLQMQAQLQAQAQTQAQAQRQHPHQQPQQQQQHQLQQLQQQLQNAQHQSQQQPQQMPQPSLAQFPPGLTGGNIPFATFPLGVGPISFPTNSTPPFNINDLTPQQRIAMMQALQNSGLHLPTAPSYAGFGGNSSHTGFVMNQGGLGTNVQSAMPQQQQQPSVQQNGGASIGGIDLPVGVGLGNLPPGWNGT